MNTIAISFWGTCATETPAALTWLPVEILKSQGYRVVPLGDPTANWFIAFEHNAATFSKVNAISSASRRVLVTFEPRAVNPSMYSREARGNYGHVLVPNQRHKVAPEDIIYGGGGLSPRLELAQNLKEFSRLQRKPGTISMVNENKFSLVPGALYTLRARTIKLFLREGVQFNLAGKHWHQGWRWYALHHIDAARKSISAKIFPDLRLIRKPFRRNANLLNYAGLVESSVAFMANYEFAVVIENEASYVTEKLFNAVQAGAVPIYVGPDLQEFGIPREVAIQVQPRSRSILQAFRQTPIDDREKVREAGLRWIQDPSTYQTFSHEASFMRIGQKLSEILGQESESA